MNRDTIRGVLSSDWELACTAEVRFEGSNYDESIGFYRSEVDTLGQYSIGYESLPPATCEKLAPEIIDFSRANPPAIVRMHRDTIRRIQSTEYELDCVAEGRFSDYDTDMSIRFYRTDADRRGEYFIGYEPTREAVQKELEKLEQELEAELKKIAEEIEAEIKKSLEAEQETQKADESNPFPVTLSEIMTDYRAHEIRADVKYSQPYSLQADVAKIESSGPYAVLLLQAGGFNIVEAYFSDKGSLVKVEAGNRVRLTCRGADGSSDNIGVIIKLRECTLNE